MDFDAIPFAKSMKPIIDRERNYAHPNPLTSVIIVFNPILPHDTGAQIGLYTFASLITSTKQFERVVTATRLEAHENMLNLCLRSSYVRICEFSSRTSTMGSV